MQTNHAHLIAVRSRQCRGQRVARWHGPTGCRHAGTVACGSIDDSERVEGPLGTESDTPITLLMIATATEMPSRSHRTAAQS